MIDDKAHFAFSRAGQWGEQGGDSPLFGRFSAVKCNFRIYSGCFWRSPFLCISLTPALECPSKIDNINSPYRDATSYAIFRNQLNNNQLNGSILYQLNKFTWQM
ncbi:hypothetical protein QWU01_07580 [Kluyvera cryocrescens]|uniref:Uncharacterized protein n=1 Tax=Kluyvera cryocrescens TaxID=580 RepID=A0AAW9C436_KLUCR|nr:hypothetical protein [Kluyvera cryocrescens]